MATDPAYYEAQDLEALADIPNYQRWILAHFEAHLRGRVLEVGAGTGTFSQLYLDAVSEAVLLEPARNLTQRLHDRVGQSGKARILPLELDEARLPAASFDAIVLINVLEHIDDDRRMLRSLHDLLQPGGHLLLFVPALAWIYGSLDDMLGHRRRYSLAPLRQLMEDTGFEIRDIRYFDALGVLPWWVTGKILRQRKFNASAARIYDQTGVRVGRLVETRITPPFGKNILSVARRRK